MAQYFHWLQEDGSLWELENESGHWVLEDYPGAYYYLLQEDSDRLLQETDDKIVLEEAYTTSTSSTSSSTSSTSSSTSSTSSSTSMSTTTRPPNFTDLAYFTIKKPAQRGVSIKEKTNAK